MQNVISENDNGFHDRFSGTPDSGVGSVGPTSRHLI